MPAPLVGYKRQLFAWRGKIDNISFPPIVSPMVNFLDKKQVRQNPEVQSSCLSTKDFCELPLTYRLLHELRNVSSSPVYRPGVSEVLKRFP